MKKLLLKSRNFGGFVQLPVEFIDSYLAEAGGTALKVYLYLVRCLQDPTVALSLGDMADLFDVTPNKVLQALLYWQQLGLLQVSFDDGEATGITLLPLPERKHASSEKPLPEEAPAVPAAPAKPAPVEGVIDQDDLMADDSFTSLLQLAEFYLKKPLSAAMRDAMAYAYTALGKQEDMTEYLLEYCISRDHANPHYLRSVAGAWAKEGYATLDELREANQARNSVVYGVLSALGIRNRAPVKSETEFIERWTSDFDLPVVLEAANRTMARLHSPDFNYVNKILERWKASGVTCLEDIEKLDSGPKKAATGPRKKASSFQNFDQRDVNYDELIRKFQNPDED
ncbi:MAG: DnaD domain protein [Lachnospiraceae bacterium]|nr:DnaD domain protein [Lachnospiraceae bacterium]